MFKRPHYIALGLVGLLTLIVLNLPHQAAGKIKLAIGSLFLPLFGISKSTQEIAGQAGNAIVPRAELIKQNEQLRRANEELLLRMRQADAAYRENDHLRQLFEWQKTVPWKLKLASVIARDPANWWHVIQVDLGSRDGMKPDMAVMSAFGLVGRISAVSLTSSQVVLIGSPECKVAALIEKTGDTGVITGISSKIDNTLVTMSFLSSNNNLKPGQRVVTWGEGNLFVKGIPIGQVAEESHQGELGYAEARIKLAADLGKLEEVWVLIK